MLPRTLWNFAKQGSGSRYAACHAHLAYADETLRTFLHANMDEVRLRRASEFASVVLRSMEAEDADYLRRELLRREVWGDVSYPSQRDHSAHTVYNYLLGWYVYCHSQTIRQSLARHFTARNWAQSDHEGAFAELWPLVSLLHDVGYLLEGTVPVSNTSGEDTHISTGADIVHNYFGHVFWQKSGIPTMPEQASLLALTGILPPSFSSRSMQGLTAALRSLGDLERIREEAAAKNPAGSLVAALQPGSRIPTDAFDVWSWHYRVHGTPSMVQRMDSLLYRYVRLAEEGERMSRRQLKVGWRLRVHVSQPFASMQPLGRRPGTTSVSRVVYSP